LLPTYFYVTFLILLIWLSSWSLSLVSSLLLSLPP
jgi:hypothetical protein